MAKANDVIQVCEEGFELNYGPLVVVEIEGTMVAMQDWRATQLGLSYKTPMFFPEFYKALRLDVSEGNAQIEVYVFKKEDLKAVGLALSKIRPTVRVSVLCCARLLMVWQNGEVVSEQKPLSHFYDGLTPEQITASTF